MATGLSFALLTVLVVGMACFSSAFSDPIRNISSLYKGQGLSASVCPLPTPNKLELSRPLSSPNIHSSDREGDSEIENNLIGAAVCYSLSDCEEKSSVAISVIDFEDPEHEDYFTAEPSTPVSTCESSTKYHKNGNNSLFWTWPAKTSIQKSIKRRLTLDLSKKAQIRTQSKELKNGGIKFWMYRANNKQQSKMKIFFIGKDSLKRRLQSKKTEVDLNFMGWRAVWIGYKEFPSSQFASKTLKKVEFRITSAVKDSLYIDLIQFMNGLGKQSRDLIVPIVGETVVNRPPFYTEKDFWQRSLRWQQEGVARGLLTPPSHRNVKIADIGKIERRIENWYLDETESVELLEQYDPSTFSSGEYDFQKAKKIRWVTLSEDISEAHALYEKINFTENRPSLFTKESDFGEDIIKTGSTAMTKFGYVFHKILLPLSIEYSFMTREKQKDALKTAYCNTLKTSQITAEHATSHKFAGPSSVLRQAFETIVNNRKSAVSAGLNCDSVINELNQRRFGRIKKLLVYLQDQGWAEGSGLGSIEHEMNKAGSGFMNSMFLIRHALRSETALFQSLLKAMKWYNDFNEIYQDDNDYIYDGSTADRIRTIFLYRLFIIMVDNGNKDKQINNLEYLRTWGKHALRVNKGLGGLIKPDHTGFHHKTFYGVAYVPHALHNAALMQFFLDGTSFAFPQETKDNIRKCLEVMRITAVKYSTPNGLCGRFPNYTRAILAEHVPAYAYISYVHGQTASQDQTDRPEMFLRLFQTDFASFDAYLKEGKIRSGIYYWNTIGSLDVLKKVKTLPCSGSPPCAAESSPHGHWSKNFAALSIHRRGDWSVAAKGMNRYTWDYENSNKENVLGLFGSHGSLQISNSEEALKAYNVTEGWDWRRVPGTTTIDMSFKEMRLKKAKNYNYIGKFAGGVSFSGSQSLRNGAFGMNFKQPKYKMKEKIPNLLKKSELRFKKSYFFYNDLIICLGSNIKLGPKSTTFAQTTLFQDKMLDGKKITVDNIDKTTTFSQDWTSVTTVQLKDTNNNIYQVRTGDNILKVQIADQTSKNTTGCTDTTAKYALAYLKHANGRTSNYEYAIIVAGGDDGLLTKYSVIKQNRRVHAIKIEEDPINEIYGYSVFEDFEANPINDGIVRSASASCMIMAEKTSNTIYLAISDPSLRFQDDPTMASKKTCTETDRKASRNPKKPKASKEVGSKMMFCVKAKASNPIKVTLNVVVQSVTSVKVDGETQQNTTMHVQLDNSDPTKSKLTFNNLKNGFSTEVQLEL